ncbi:phage structural protein [Paenibacillus campi]|uniref:phage structural protein n=1 Tax=Paenibacillus campi TaxID=3106031 RepID=UPI002AFF2478|nr:phage protein [Paenibacillus sp. SGZ-1014]
MATYDPKDVTLQVGGVFITEFSEDMIEIEKDEENYSVKVGAQGDPLRSKVNNPLATMTVTLLMSSPQVEYMTKLARTGELVPVSCIHNGTPKETTTATEAFVKKLPTRTYGSEAEDREFELQLMDMDQT